MGERWVLGHRGVEAFGRVAAVAVRCGGGAGSGGSTSTGMAAQLGWPRRLGRIKVLAVWLSGWLSGFSGCLAEAGRLSGGWVAIWLGGW